MYYINYFFIFSILGHFIESFFYPNSDSGILYGYWTPIYGIGTIIILLVNNYVNKKRKTEHIISNLSESMTYDGSLLEKNNILLNSISCGISFDIYITNNLDQKFKCPIYIEIPLDNETNSIYDGSFTLIDNTNFTFYRYN